MPVGKRQMSRRASQSGQLREKTFTPQWCYLFRFRSPSGPTVKLKIALTFHLSIVYVSPG